MTSPINLATLLLFLLAAGSCAAQTSPPNWTGDYAPCDRHADLLNPDHVDLGVRISTSDAVLAREFERAMDFWTGILDMAWHRVDSAACAIQLVEGTPELFRSEACTCLTARSQLPDRAGFQGWIAFNTTAKATQNELYATAVHEVGHLLGLPHNARGSSVMFFLALDGPVSLNAADYAALAGHHKIRAVESQAVKSK